MAEGRQYRGGNSTTPVPIASPRPAGGFLIEDGPPCDRCTRSILPDGRVRYRFFDASCPRHGKRHAGWMAPGSTHNGNGRHPPAQNGHAPGGRRHPAWLPARPGWVRCPVPSCPIRVPEGQAPPACPLHGADLTDDDGGSYATRTPDGQTWNADPAGPRADRVNGHQALDGDSLDLPPESREQTLARVGLAPRTDQDGADDAGDGG